MNKKNTILIVFDELTNYLNLPKDILENLKGYKLFKNRCVEFSNMQTSRQQCTPSRSTIISGIYDTGLQDNIDYSYQYDYIPVLPENIETTGKIYKKNNYDITTYYGKQHLSSKLAPTIFETPAFVSATTLAMKIYGYDKFNVFGDTYYAYPHGLLQDNQVLSYELPPNSSDFDYIENNIKYSGVIPFIKARLEDKKTFYIECHITNPHDTNHYIQNFTETPASSMNQFPTPYYFEQLKEAGVPNIYEFNQADQYSVPTHPNLLKNYFENKYSAYKSNKFELPFLTSYELDYAISPKVNSYNPFLIGTYYALKIIMTISDSQDDITNWKNFINNYYGLVYEADSYLEKLYYFFEENGLFDTCNILIIADHGDQLSAHGLKQKQVPFKECSNVPCLIYSPNLSKKLIGKTVDFYCSLVDILPTQIEMNNLSTTSQFDGKSLLIWKDGELHINCCEHKNYIPLNIVNSTMYSLNYFNYVLWYFQFYTGQELSSNPLDYFEFQSSFCSIITEINGTKYKFGRYYSIYSEILYYLFINKNQNIFSKLDLLSYINTIQAFYKIAALKYFEIEFNNIFTFEEGLNKIKYDFNDNNIYLLYVYYGFISNLLNRNNNLIYLVPGSLSSWELNYNLNIFSYFLYNIDTDNSESFNLLDPKNIEYVNIQLKNQLNDLLNLSLKEKRCQEIKTIIPDNVFLQLANYLYIFGGFISIIITSQLYLEILNTLNGTNSFDISITTASKTLYQQNITLSVNKINNTNLLNPYNLYNISENKYYVGEFDYVKFIYTNFPYFSNFVFTQGFPDLKGKNFIVESNNVLPYLNVYKIIDNIV